MVDIDRITVEQVKKGDNKAFQRLYDHYAPFVWRIVFRTAGNDQEFAGEIVQETFINIHRHIRKFSGNSSLGTWIYRIAFNAATTLLAKRTKFNRMAVHYNDDLHGTGYSADAYDVRELAGKMLSRLSVEERFLMVAREIDGMSFDELALVTGKSAEALRIQMFRIKEKFVPKSDKRPRVQEGVNA